MIYIVALDPHSKQMVVRSPVAYTAREFLMHECKLMPGISSFLPGVNSAMCVDSYPSLESIEDSLLRHGASCAMWGWRYWIRANGEGLSQDLSRDGIQDLEE